MMEDALVLISIENLIRDNTFGPVRIGMTAGQVGQLLGEPDEKGLTSRKFRTPSLWKYGDFELGFDKNAAFLWYFSIDLSCKIGKDIDGGKNLKVDSMGIFGGLLIEKFLELLDSRKIKYSERSPVNAYAREIVAGQSAEFIFTEHSSSEPHSLGLEKFGCYLPETLEM